MQKLGEAVLNKVRTEAESVLREAEQKAQEEIQKAKGQRASRLEEEKRRLLAQAEEEAARILAQASIKARQRLSTAKANVLDKVVDDARQKLSQSSGSESDMLRLIKEAMDGLGTSKGRIYVAPRDVGLVKRALETDQVLSGRVIEVRETACLGGVIAEDVEGKLRIDNTYEARLENLLPRILPEISKELFATP